MADLGIAIQRFQEAFDITPVDHPDQASRLQSFGIAYEDRYQRTGVIVDLKTTIQQY
jgi:hypothetical protein